MIYADLLKNHLISKRYNIKEIYIQGDKYIRSIEIKFNNYNNFNKEDFKNDIDTYLMDNYEYYNISKPEIYVI